MNYLNDESDKSIRRKNYYGTVFGLPILAALLFCGLVYWASEKNFISRSDSYYGYFFSITIFLLFHGFNKRNWLKMPDGTFSYIRNVTNGNMGASDGPLQYEEEYFISRKKMTGQIFFGVLAIGMGIFLAISLEKSVLVPMGTMAMGIFLSYQGINGLLDHGPRLKLAKKGLWTRKLGFVDWKNISRAEVTEDSSGKTTQYILEIYLIGTVFAEANKPDERLFLTDLENYQYIEMVIENLMSKKDISVE